MRYGTAFKPVNLSKLSQLDIYEITGYLDLPIGSEIFVSRGYGDNDDCYEYRANYLLDRLGVEGKDASAEFWTKWYCTPDGIKGEQLDEMERMQDSFCMFCMGGEL